MLKRIKNKLLNINALVKADKGNTTEQYNMKVDEFIQGNNISKISANTTSKFVKLINNVVNNFTSLFNEA